MYEQDYWMNKANQDTIQFNLSQEAQLNYWATKRDLVLVESLQPKISKDGNQWCVLYGDNLQEGIAGFGETPIAAILDFNTKMYTN